MLAPKERRPTDGALRVQQGDDDHHATSDARGSYKIEKLSVAGHLVTVLAMKGAADWAAS
jgi:hypothetical protein